MNLFLSKWFIKSLTSFWLGQNLAIQMQQTLHEEEGKDSSSPITTNYAQRPNRVQDKEMLYLAFLSDILSDMLK